MQYATVYSYFSAEHNHKHITHSSPAAVTLILGPLQVTSPTVNKKEDLIKILSILNAFVSFQEKAEFRQMCV